jgi:prophage tail gpP-like protein
MSVIYPDLRPNVSTVRALVTTRWSGSSYRPIVIPRVESYYVDTSLDNDADTWTFDVGDPTGHYMELFNRDAEIRCQLYGVGLEGQHYIITGIADEVSFDEQGSITFTGRDLSSLATDSTATPKRFKHVRAWAIVDEQARYVGFQQTRLSRAPMVKKLQYTDGSESYWEFWYRLYRKEKMWLWTEPDGMLVAGRLNYNGQISYYLGEPKAGDSQYVKRMYIPVERAEIRKSTQARVYEVWVYGHRGDNGFLAISKDPTMTQWVKKPRKVMLDTEPNRSCEHS